MDNRTARISTSVTPAQFDELRRVAEKNNRRVSEELREIIREYLEKKEV